MKTTINLRFSVDLDDSSGRPLAQDLIRALQPFLMGPNIQGRGTSDIEVILPHRLLTRATMMLASETGARTTLDVVCSHTLLRSDQIKADRRIIPVQANGIQVGDILVDGRDEWPVTSVTTEFAHRQVTTVTIDTGRPDDHPANLTETFDARGLVVVRRK